MSQNIDFFIKNCTYYTDKVTSAFSNIEIDGGCERISESCIVQLWAPVTIGGRLQLSTYRQPFAVTYLDKDLLKYRRRCVEYGYNVNIDDMIEQDVDKPPLCFLQSFARDSKYENNCPA